MKQNLSKLRLWWFETLVPVHTPPITIHERETIRKRRLLSIILLVMFLAAFLFTIECFIVTTLHGVPQIGVGSGCITLLLSLWINRNGHLQSASAFFVFSTLLEAIFEIISVASRIPFFGFFIWNALLLFPVAAGLFLPAWGALSCACVEILFVFWFIFIEQHSLIATMLSKADQKQFLVYCCIIITSISVFSAISAETNKKAVIQADRAVELEQAHQALSASYVEQEKAHEKLEMIHKELEEAYTTIHKQALTDALTGLPNHRAVIDQLSKELEHARRYQRSLSILFFDADRFKYVNDTYGHATGDVVLQQIGKRASRALRIGDTLGRFGGEEFVVLLPETNGSEAHRVAERIRSAVAAEPVSTPEVEGSINITVSIGLSTYLVDGDSEQVLLAQADEAMYMAKRMGRNQVRTATEVRQTYASEEHPVYA